MHAEVHLPERVENHPSEWHKFWVDLSLSLDEMVLVEVKLLIELFREDLGVVFLQETGAKQAVNDVKNDQWNAVFKIDFLLVFVERDVCGEILGAKQFGGLLNHVTDTASSVTLFEPFTFCHHHCHLLSHLSV